MSNTFGDNPVDILHDITSVMQYSLPADSNLNVSAKTSSRIMDGDEKMAHAKTLTYLTRAKMKMNWRLRSRNWKRQGAENFVASGAT